MNREIEWSDDDDDDSLLTVSLHLRREKIERKRVYYISPSPLALINAGQFRKEAWSVSATILMINLKRIARSFEVVSLLDCAFWHTLLFSIHLTIKILIVLDSNNDDEDNFRFDHLLDLSLHTDTLLRSTYPSFVQTMPLNGYSLLLTVKGSFTTIERKKLNLNFQLEVARTTMTVTCLSKATH